MNQKINYIWWTVAVHLLQMADAYVDANLADWSAEVGPDPARPRDARRPGLSRPVLSPTA